MESQRILEEVLYGKWPQWDGQEPPPTVIQSKLSTLPSEVRQSAPPQVRFGVSTLPLPQIGIFATEVITEGTEIGPYPGHLKSNTSSNSNHDQDNSWEVFDRKGELVGLVTSDVSITSWINYIQCARHEQEQNLATFQLDGAIYYRVTKTIERNEELMVWYGPHTPQCLGIPDVWSPINFFQPSAEEVVMSASAERKLRCVVCRRGFNSRSNLRSHMRVHTLQRPFACRTCGRRFSQSSTLRNHLRLHTGEKPYKCNVCQSAYSQLAGLRAHQRSSRHRPRNAAV